MAGIHFWRTDVPTFDTKQQFKPFNPISKIKMIKLNQEQNIKIMTLKIFLTFSCVFGMCVGLGKASVADDWPHWLGPRHDGVWREKGIVKVLPETGAKYKWRVPINKGYTGPAVVDGRLYVMDRIEKEEEKKDVPARDAEGKGKDEKKERARTPGFPSIGGTERVLCLDANTGEEIWKHEYECVYQISYPEGPRTTPVVEGDFVYTLGAMGNLFCLNKETGEKVWHKNLTKAYKTKPPVWGFSAHQRIYGDKLVLVVGGEGSAVVCLNKKNGKQIWKAETAKEVGYAPPVPMEIGMGIQLVYWSDEAITGLDLESGKKRWTIKFPEVPVQRPIVTIMTPQISGRKIMVSNFYNGSCVVEVAKDGNSVKKLWSADPQEKSHKTGLNILMGTPLVHDGHIYGFAGKGEMRCVELESGKQVWEEKSPANADRASYFATAFITPHEDRYFVFNDQGELIIANFDAKGYKELSRTKILEPSTFVRGRNIVWSHPAYANKCMFVRNSKELVCVDLSE